MKKYNWNIWNQNPKDYLNREMTDDDGNKVKLVACGININVYLNNKFLTSAIDINNIIFWLNSHGVA